MQRILCSFVILGLIVIALVYRLPFLSNVLIGEEGAHAYLVLGPKPVINSTDPSIMWSGTEPLAYGNFAGRLDGKDFMAYWSRNPVAYELLDKGARAIGQILPLCQESSMRCISVRARAPFLVLFLLGVFIGLVAISDGLVLDRGSILITQLLSIVYLLSAPLLVAGSIQPQLDGALGVLVVATSSAILLLSDSLTFRSRVFAGFAAGIVGALVKNEWAIALAAATVITTILSIVIVLASASLERDISKVWQAIGFCLATLVGISVCQLLLFLYEPFGFLGGLGYMRQIATDQHLSIYDNFRNNWPVIYPVVIACASVAGLLLIRLPQYCIERPSLVLVSGWALIIAAGYIYSGQAGDGFPRYFCPAGLLAALVLPLLIAGFKIGRLASLIATAVLAFGLYVNTKYLVISFDYRVSIGTGRLQSLDAVEARYARDAEISRERGAAIMEGSALGIYFRDVDWVTSENGLEGSIDMVRHLRPNREPLVYVPEPYLGWCAPDLIRYTIGCPG